MHTPQITERESESQVGQYFQCNEYSDVENSLLLLKHSLGLADDEPAYWKWIIIATHSALQGACVCILTKTDGTGALTKKSQKEALKKLYGEENGSRNLDNPDIPWPDPYIAPLDELLKRLPDGLKIVLPDRKAESYGYEIAGDLRRLSEFRNMMIHFPPSSWSLELAGLPRILERAVCLIKDIVASEANNRVNQFAGTPVQSLIEEIKLMIGQQP